MFLEPPSGDHGEHSQRSHGRKLVASTSSSCGSSDAVAMDDDDDLVLDRRMKRHRRRDEGHVLTVQHIVTYSLRSIGLLAGEHSLSDFLPCIVLLSFVVHCLLLLVYRFVRQPCCLPDFVLHKSFTSSEFDGVTAMEIGVGTGDGLL